MLPQYISLVTVKARDLIFHCSACNCDLKISNKTKHLKPLKHDKAEHPEKYAIAEDKRKCAHCKATKGLDEFRNENVTCNRCLEVNMGAQSKSPEMKAVYDKEYRENISMTNIIAHAVINP